jgi:hypothetical protein
MSEDTVGDAARVVNIPTLEFPLQGRFTPEGWAAKLNNDADTIRRWIRQYNVPFKMLGNSMLVEANDLWDAVPKQRHSDNPPKRGGSQKKKAS